MELKANITIDLESLRESINKCFNSPSLKELSCEINLLPAAIRLHREEVSKKRIAQRTLRQSLADAELALKEAEAALLSDITAEINPLTNKSAYSNDKARQAELMARKKTDPDYLAAANNYRAIMDQCNAIEDEILSLEAGLEQKRNELTSLAKQCELITAETFLLQAIILHGGSQGSGNLNNNQHEKGVW